MSREATIDFLSASSSAVEFSLFNIVTLFKRKYYTAYFPDCRIIVAMDFSVLMIARLPYEGEHEGAASPLGVRSVDKALGKHRVVPEP